MRHIMIDLETLGTNPDAPIIAIGAVLFDPATGEQGATFYEAVDFEDACRRGAASGSTIKWWLGQSDAARAAVVKGEALLEDVLRRFRMFCVEESSAAPIVWGNGATFDISILEHAHRQIGRNVPWKFFDVRDCRTVAALGEGLDVDRSMAKGVAHHALDDAVSQARWVSEIWMKLRAGVEAAAG